MSLIRKPILSDFSLLDENDTINLCRICLEDGAKIPIFPTNEEESYNVLSKLSLCLKEKVEDIEGYPRCICSLCSSLLDTAYNFINKYKETCKILESGVDIVKQEDEPIPIHNNNLVDEIVIDNIKNEVPTSISDSDGFSDDDKQLIKPLKLKIELEVEREPKLERKKFSTPNTNTKQVTNKVTSSILEGQFAWTGNKWCLKSSNGKRNAEEISRRLIKLKSETKKKRRVKIEIPKTKKPNPPKLCDLCGEVFKDQDKLSIHKKNVHFRKTMKCPECPKVLCSDYYLNKHMKRKHAETKDFVCAKCGRAFAFKAELRSHNKCVHEKHLRPKKQFKCKFCPKTYKCPKSVIVHERSAHTGLRPAVCSVCSSSFYHDDYLKEHMRLHTGETPFKCPICGRGYAQRCNMKSHLRIHRVSELDADTLSKLRPNYLRLLKA